MDTMERAVRERDDAEKYRDAYVEQAQAALRNNDYGGFSMYADRAKQMEVLRRVIAQRIIDPDA